ncbi:MAG TPA: hypothetical protein VMP01_30140 [Pirellulaceae bacterium]|nr:hypothetical protein [Pirellulaceae bacterium]
MRRTELTIEEILAWADAYYARKGRWPDQNSGKVWEPVNEKWRNIDQSLRLGQRGLHRGSSLAKLLAKHRGKRNRKALPKYTVAQILKWADEYKARKRRWPRNTDGLIANSHGETWMAVDMALRHGQRGMRGGSSLAQLLLAKRRVPNHMVQSRLTVRQILNWADDHRRRTGNWPSDESGFISRSVSDTWRAVCKALRQGRRGLRRSSLAKLLEKHRGVPRQHHRQPPLTIRQVLEWADAYHARTGKWPVMWSGPIAGARGESWNCVHRALVAGKRGLPGGITLSALLAKKRGARNRADLPPLTEAQILRWARAYKREHGRWPNRHSGPIAGSGGETWCGVRVALNHAGRGLKRRTTLKRLIEAHS